MFRRLSGSLPKDPDFPADLERLGYYINGKDQIRSITHPDQEFNFFISKNERVREVQREAMDTCIRREITSRFHDSNLSITRLPMNVEATESHVPILTSPNLGTAKRLIIYFGESMQDLGIFAYRVVGQESISSGSALDFVHAIQTGKDSEETAIVVANTGQLVWYRRGQRAMTSTSWNGLPRKTGVSEAMRVDPIKNHIPGNKNVKEHVGSVFEMVGKMAKKDVAINVIGLGEGAEEMVAYLDANWGMWEGRVRAVCVGLGYIWRVGEEVKDRNFKAFWGKRARAYLIHNEPVDTLLSGREEIGCNCLSSGEAAFTECIMPRAYKSMLAFFQLVNDVPGYEELEAIIPKDEDDPSMFEHAAPPESPAAA